MEAVCKRAMVYLLVSGCYQGEGVGVWGCMARDDSGLFVSRFSEACERVCAGPGSRVGPLSVSFVWPIWEPPLIEWDYITAGD